jgi:hypothetical protein
MKAFARGLAAVALWLGACGGIVGKPTAGGESHFLRHCFEGCGSLECVSDICTRSCLVDRSSCADLSSQARCTNTSIEPGEIAVCDLSCSQAADCAVLGEAFACDGGFCRSTAQPASGSGGGGGLDLGNVSQAGAATAEVAACSLSNVSPTELGLDAMPCADRRVEPCAPVDGQSQQDALNQQLDGIMQSCGARFEVMVRVVFEAGCATRLSASLPGPNGAEQTTCIGQALDLLSFACASGLDCASMEHSTIK